MFKFAYAGLIACCVVAPAAAQDVVDTAVLAKVVAEVCIFDDLDFDAQYDALTTGAATAGLPVMVEQEQTTVFGNPAATHLVVGRKVDELFCSLRLPQDVGTKAVFAAFEAQLDAAIQAAFPKHISQPKDDPSPHVLGHDWVASVPGEMHYAATLGWGTETGLLVAIGFRQLYE